MKTNQIFPENGIAITLDALIFANRNKAYGAFELRRKYKKHLFVAFAIALFLFTSGISVPYIQTRFFGKEALASISRDVPYEVSKLDDLTKIIPPKIDIPTPVVPRFQPIFIVVDNNVDVNSELIPTDEWIENTDNTYEETALIPIVKPEDSYIDPDKNEGLVVVQENATFQGGDLRSFQIWVQSNITYPVDAAQANIQGRVILEFCVNTKGEICDIRVLRELHPSMSAECVKVLMNSPKWTPAKQNGRLVKQKFTLPVQFVLAS